MASRSERDLHDGVVIAWREALAWPDAAHGAPAARERKRPRAADAPRVTVTGHDLTIADVVRVARDGAGVALAPAAIARMKKARAVVERALRRGSPVYGTNTGVAARKRVAVGAGDVARFNRLLLDNHRVGQGPLASREIVRAALLCVVNGFARGTSPARPALAERVVAALDRRTTPRVRTLGSVGAADLAPNADLARAILGRFPLAAGEGLALLNNSAFATGAAALAVFDARRLLESLELAGALDLEAFGANLSILHPAVSRARGDDGLAASRARLADLLDGSSLWEPGAARNLQDPLTFRGMPQLFGAARDALAFVERRIATELNAAQDNPLVVPEEDRVISAWNGEMAGLSAALDFLRIALAPVITSACERLLKLLQAPLSGLPDGLAARAGLAEDGLAEYGVAAQSLAAEARLLAQPVSFELASTTQAEGIEDRTTMAPLAARRLAEMVDLGARLATVELVVAAQAIDLRGTRARLGRGTRRAFARVRALVPFQGEGRPIVPDLEPLYGAFRSGRFALR